MYGRGNSSQSPRFSPNRRGGSNYQSPYNNNNVSPSCGYRQQQHYPRQNSYRPTSPGGPRSQQMTPSPQFQMPFPPMDSPFFPPGMRSPYRNHGNGSFSHNGGASPRNPAGYSSPFSRSPRHFSPYTSSPRGRGNFSHGKTSTPNFRGRARGAFCHKSKNDSRKESNPGGSSNIAMYYNSTMMEDPWRELRPLPFTHKPSATT